MINMKKLAAVAGLSAAVVSPAAMAGLTGNIGIFSEYLFRGFQESAGEPAVQGGLDYEMDSGLYVGTWISTLNRDYTNGDPSGTYETDLYAGYGFNAGGIDLDVGVLYYYYRGDTSLNTVEYYVGAGMGPFSLSLSYGEEVFGGDADLLYTNVGADFPLTETVAIGGYLGFSSFSGDDSAKDYFDYGVTLSKDLGNDFGFSISLVGVDRPSATGLRTEQVVLGLTKDFSL